VGNLTCALRKDGLGKALNRHAQTGENHVVAGCRGRDHDKRDGVDGVGTNRGKGSSIARLAWKRPKDGWMRSGIREETRRSEAPLAGERVAFRPEGMPLSSLNYQ